MKPPLIIKVLLVDDSPMVRTCVAGALARYPDIRLVGGAKDAFEARELIIQHRPDVIVLDVELPRIDGLTFLRKLMAHYPVPVIMCSDTATTHSRTALEAIALGALDVVQKPTNQRQALSRLGDDLAEKIRAAAIARPAPPPIPAQVNAAPLSFWAAGLDPNDYVVAIGASTGGTEAIRHVLMHVPEDFPPVVMVQHMPAGFTRSFAARLDRDSRLEVREAVGDECLESGQAYLARGGIQMLVYRQEGRLRLAYGTNAPVNRHCPSVEVLFDSVARAAGPQAVGLLLTGMGADGAEGLLHLRQAGALTIAQTQASCVVYGMPKVAVELDAAEYQCAPEEAPALITRTLQAQIGARGLTQSSRSNMG